MKRFMKILGGTLPFFAAIAIQGVVVFILSIGYYFMVGIIVAFKAIENGLNDMEEVINEVLYRVDLSGDMIYLMSTIAILVCGIVFTFWYRYQIRNSQRVNLKSILTGRHIGVFVLLGLGCQLFVAGLLSLLLPLNRVLSDNYNETMQSIISGHPVLVLILVILIAPVVEELIFRGVVYQMSIRVLPMMGANLFQAALFGIYHWNIVQGLYAFLIGLILGYVYHKFRTILAPILLHMIINGSSFLMRFGNRMVIYIGMVVVGGVIIAFAIQVMRRMSDPEMVAPKHLNL